jgi:hypothetical protein
VSSSHPTSSTAATDELEFSLGQSSYLSFVENNAHITEYSGWNLKGTKVSWELIAVDSR